MKKPIRPKRAAAKRRITYMLWPGLVSNCKTAAMTKERNPAKEIGVLAKMRPGVLHLSSVIVHGRVRIGRLGQGGLQVLGVFGAHSFR